MRTLYGGSATSPLPAAATATGRLEVVRVAGVWRARPLWHPGLRPYLREYAGYWEAVPSPYRVRMVPSARAVLVISLGEPFSDVRRLTPGDCGDGRSSGISGGGVTSGASGRSGGSGGSGRIGSLVVGLADGPAQCVHPGGQEAIRLEFTPLGAYRLFGGLPMQELTGRFVELRDVLGRSAEELIERLADLRDWGRRFDLLDAVLLDRLAQGPSPAPEVVRAWRLLAAGGGTVPIGRIAAEVGWSRRYLSRRFAEQIGLTPKVASRVLRFEQAVALLNRGATPTEAAISSGYFDQAHLTREFRALSGTTPRRMLTSRRSEGALAL